MVQTFRTRTWWSLHSGHEVVSSELSEFSLKSSKNPHLGIFRFTDDAYKVKKSNNIPNEAQKRPRNGAVFRDFRGFLLKYPSKSLVGSFLWLLISNIRLGNSSGTYEGHYTLMMRSSARILVDSRQHGPKIVTPNFANTCDQEKISCLTFFY